MTGRVSLRVMVTRADMREIDRRADATRTSREVVASSLIAQSLDARAAENVPSSAQIPAAELQSKSPDVATADFGRAVFADAVRAQPGLAPVLLRLLGGKP